MIIFLNGSSSAGKTSISQEILNSRNDLFFYYSVDNVIGSCIDAKFSAGRLKDWFNYRQKVNQGGGFITTLSDGEKAMNFHHDMILALKVLAERGNNLLIDEVIWNQESFLNYVFALRNIYPFYLIKIHCDLAEAERRERKRKDRHIGLARGLLYQMENCIPFYDLEVDTTNISPKEASIIIEKFIAQNPHPDAFEKSLKTMFHDNYAPNDISWDDGSLGRLLN